MIINVDTYKDVKLSELPTKQLIALLKRTRKIGCTCDDCMSLERFAEIDTYRTCLKALLKDREHVIRSSESLVLRKIKHIEGKNGKNRRYVNSSGRR
jgi:hypothetical protein